MGATIPQMVAAIIALDMECRDDRAPEITIPVPAAISLAALKSNPDLAGMSANDKNCATIRGYVARPEIAALIRKVETGKTTEISKTFGATTVLIYDKPLPVSAERLALGKRLRKLQAIAEKRWNAENAPEKARERRQTVRDDRACRIEARLVRMKSKSAADLVAKATLYQHDPARFEDAAKGNFSVSESLARDVVALLGKAVRS
jgi:hypothetical protein